MKNFHMALAGVALAFAAPVAFAQTQDTAPGAAVKFAVETPKPKCEDPGEYPGRVGMQTEDRRNKFVKGVETYRTCMLNFVDERKAVIKANETSARQAIDDFNARMKKLTDEQEKSKE
jgi:hypothetical protein